MPSFRRTGAVIVGLVAAATIVAAGATWYLLAVRLPDPRTASRAGLGRWLVLRDVSAEPREVQLALVDRLQAELKSGLAAESASVPLAPAYRLRLRENAEYLQQVWLWMMELWSRKIYLKKLKKGFHQKKLQLKVPMKYSSP